MYGTGAGICCRSDGSDSGYSETNIYANPCLQPVDPFRIVVEPHAAGVDGAGFGHLAVFDAQCERAVLSFAICSTPKVFSGP